MILQGAAIPNLIIEVMGIMICIFALITIWYDNSISLTSTKRNMTIAFGSMFLYNVCLLLLELSQAAERVSWRAGVALVAFGTYLFPMISAYVVSLFVVSQSDYPPDRYSGLLLALRTILFINIIVLFAAQFLGKLIIVDPMGRFSYGNASKIGFVGTTVFMIIDLVILIRHGQNMTSRQRNAFIAYLSLPIAGVFLKQFWGGVYIAAFATCLSMMIMLSIIQKGQSDQKRQQEKDNEQLKVDLMLSQIQPHFLFNVLYVIQEICLVDAETASKAIADFSRYLRHNMDSLSINRPIPFSEELEHVKHYVSLQQLRFGDALDVRYELSCTDFELPTLTLQPLVENAIRYGVRKNKYGEGTVVIRSEEFPDHYEIHVIDDGPGFMPDQLPDDGMSHTGIINVRQRLERICGGELRVLSGPDQGTDAAIILPK